MMCRIIQKTSTVLFIGKQKQKKIMDLNNLTPEYLRAGLALQRLNITREMSEQLFETIINIIDKGGEFTIYDACKIASKYETETNAKSE
jgi:hypothetical protein